MNEHRFLNPHQPQTLVSATLLCYLEAVFDLLFGTVATTRFVALIIIVGLAVGAFGIANEKNWGYWVALAAAILQVVMILAVFGTAVLAFGPIINLMFAGILVALLLHPMSRDYQRIWFK